MKALGGVLLLIGLMALAASSHVASSPSFDLVTAAASFDLNYSDPASDVVKLWTINMTPVLTSGGELTMSPTPSSVNLRWIRSANASADANLTIETMGDIANLDNTSYEIRLFTRADNTSHFIVTYNNGTTTLSSNATGFTPVDITGNSTIASAGSNPTLLNLLRIRVVKSFLGTISAWNIDATATQRGSPYTYQDYGWQVPGNPGSAPPPSPSPVGLPSWAWIAIAVGIAIVLVAIVITVRRRKPRKPET